MTEIFDTLKAGQDTIGTAGTAEQLNGGTSLSVPRGASVVVKGLPGNTTNAYVGDSGVSASTGFVLGPAETTPPLNVNDVSDIYADVDTGGEGVCWVVEQE